MTGTSMAAPHASGAAVVFSGLFPSEDAAGIRDLIVGTATEDALDPSTLGEGSPNLLLALPAGDGVIFDDDFSGLGKWPINVETGQGENAVCSGYCARIESAADTAYLGDTNPDDEYVYRVAFLLSEQGLTFGPDSEVTLFRALGAGDSTLFELLLDTGPAGFAQGTLRFESSCKRTTGPSRGLWSFLRPAPSWTRRSSWNSSLYPRRSRPSQRASSGCGADSAALQNVQLQVELGRSRYLRHDRRERPFGYRERERNGRRRALVLELQVEAGGSGDIVLAKTPRRTAAASRSFPERALWPVSTAEAGIRSHGRDPRHHQCGEL